MMGLMCMKACEDSKMNILHGTGEPDVISLNENDSFLNIMMNICQRYEHPNVSFFYLLKDFLY